MIYKTVKALLNAPKEIAFKFDTDLADGYADVGSNVTIARGDADGEYDITFDRGMGAYTLVGYSCELYKADGTTSVAILTGITSSGCTIQTRTSGSTANVAGCTVYVRLLFKRD